MTNTTLIHYTSEETAKVFPRFYSIMYESVAWQQMVLLKKDHVHPIFIEDVTELNITEDELKNVYTVIEETDDVELIIKLLDEQIDALVKCSENGVIDKTLRILANIAKQTNVYAVNKVFSNKEG